MNNDYRLGDFAYELPPALIAQHPPANRGGGRLLHLPRSGPVADLQFADLPTFLRAGDLLVFNDTRVIPGRVFGQKPSGGRVEILLERILDGDRILAHVRASKALRPGGEVLLPGGRTARLVARQGELFELELDTEPLAYFEAHGQVPLPPYITRSPEQDDTGRYQTVYAREKGAVAAPTAGLHFDDAMLERCRSLGVHTAFVTLHVGSGTFAPVRSENLDEHRMHAEYVRVSASTCDAVTAARERGGRVFAVGTTVVRSLESALQGGKLLPFAGETRLFIRPGYEFRSIDALITNFHLPESTLLMLVCAFGGYQRVLDAYRHAVAQRYRFFSYGDAMLLESGIMAG